MFLPPVFREDRTEVMHALMTAHPFGTIVSQAGGRLEADHVPMLLSPDSSPWGCLRGHFAAGNPLVRGAVPVEVLAIFQGPAAYVSPAWYPSKAEHGKVVPTWNYAVVHARGQMRFVTEPAWLRRHLEDLTAAHERQRPAPWAVGDAPEAFVARQMKGLVGFEIAIATLEGKWKVSQNKAAPDRAGVAEGLTEAAPEMAHLVRRALD